MSDNSQWLENNIVLITYAKEAPEKYSKVHQPSKCNQSNVENTF